VIFAAVSQEVERVFRMDEITDLTTVVRFDPGPEFVVVGAAKPFEGLEIGSRWGPKEVHVSTKVFRTGRSARVEEGDWVTTGGEDAERLKRLGLLSQVGSPIIVEGRVWGAISMDARQTLPPDAEERLERFTELVATAIANAESKSELAASRRRIVAASDETRRRIERDLHDGTQQRLVALGLAVRGAEADLPADREDLREELDRVARGLAEAVEDLHELSRGIHPAILSKGGLGPAVRELALRSPIAVTVDIPTKTRLPEAIEVAAYFVVSEALANAAKHSNASRIQLSLVVSDGALDLSISDNGVGGADIERGSGLVGLADRVAALGGSLLVTGQPGNGTKVTAKLPLDLEHPRSI
jgi:signal transduction histidine kinase